MITFLYGPNTFAIRQTVNLKTAEFVRKYGEHGLEKRDAADLAPESLGELLQGVSLFSPERFVLINDAAGNKQVWEGLNDWIERVPDGVHLVLVAESPDKRTKTFKSLQKHSVYFDSLQQPELVNWLVGESGKKLDRNLATFLIDRAGENQWLLKNELDKLSLHESVTKELIEDLVEPTPQNTVFELLDAVMAGKPDRARQVLANLQSGEDPYKLFGLLANQIHILAMTVAGKGKSQQEVAQAAGAHPFVVRKLSGVAANTTWAEVKEIISNLAKLDKQLKTTGADPWLLIETALMKIANR